jgi:MarR-like DNA-binding transcriptional regulator SgrR of sgrS sRNA
MSMKIIVNGKERPSIAGNQVRDILDAILQEVDGSKYFISRLLIDGKEVSANAEDINALPVAGIATLEVDVNLLNESLVKNVSNAQNYLKRLLPGIEKASELFRNENEIEANKFFVQIIDGIDWFSQVLQVVVAAQGFSLDEISIDGKTMKERHDQLTDLTLRMVDANKNRDWVLLADLLEYEILPYYEEWEVLLPALILDSSKDLPN